MGKKIGNLIALVVALWLCYFLLSAVLAKRLLTNLNECYDELGVRARINTSLTDSAIDRLYDQWEVCVKQKNSFFDNTFGKGLLKEAFEGMREDRKTNGPFNKRRDK